MCYSRLEGAGDRPVVLRPAKLAVVIFTVYSIEAVAVASLLLTTRAHISIIVIIYYLKNISQVPKKKKQIKSVLLLNYLIAKTKES